MQKLLIRRGEETYRFLQFQFDDHADGSFLILFDRERLSPERFYLDPSTKEYVPITDEKPNRFRITYHASGCVNFHQLEEKTKTIYCEPTFSITNIQLLACVSVPEISCLTRINKIPHDAVVINYPLEGEDFKGRQNFYLTVVPAQFHLEISPNQNPLALINFGEWFGVAVELGPLPNKIPPEKENYVFMGSVDHGPFQTQQVSQDQALISFHQKRQETSDWIGYWEPEQGVYRIIFPAPEYRPIDVIIEFDDPNITPAEVSVTSTGIRFRARGKGGFLKTLQPIKRIFYEPHS